MPTNGPRATAAARRREDGSCSPSSRRSQDSAASDLNTLSRPATTAAISRTRRASRTARACTLVRVRSTATSFSWRGRLEPLLGELSLRAEQSARCQRPRRGPPTRRSAGLLRRPRDVTGDPLLERRPPAATASVRRCSRPAARGLAVDRRPTDRKAMSACPNCSGRKRASVAVMQGLVGPPVGVEGVVLRSRSGRVQIGVHVGAPERIHGLLGIADQDQAGRAAGEGSLQHGPLHRIGVLELVDQHHLVALRQAAARFRPAVGILEGAGQPVQEMVVGEEAVLEETATDILAGPLGQSAEQPARILPAGRDQRGVGVAVWPRWRPAGPPG